MSRSVQAPSLSLAWPIRLQLSSSNTCCPRNAWQMRNGAGLRTFARNLAGMAGHADCHLIPLQKQWLCRVAASGLAMCGRPNASCNLPTHGIGVVDCSHIHDLQRSLFLRSANPHLHAECLRPHPAHLPGVSSRIPRGLAGCRSPHAYSSKSAAAEQRRRQAALPLCVSCNTITDMWIQHLKPASAGAGAAHTALLLHAGLATALVALHAGISGPAC